MRFKATINKTHRKEYIMTLYKDITKAVGGTPLVQLNRMMGESKSSVYVKLEFYNPSSSVKDRIAINMVDSAEASGQLKPGGVILEATSGNTGIALAMVGAARGYKVVLCMPESMSMERRALLRAYGAELILTPGSMGMNGSVKAAEELAKNPDVTYMKQFENQANFEIHYQTTGFEIINDLEGKIDIFIAGIGTGGTISGAGKRLRECNPAIEIIGVQPSASPILTGGAPGPHIIQGIGANFVPAILDQDIYSEILSCSNDDALKYAKKAAKEEGILAGISSGAALWAANEVASRSENEGKNIVVMLASFGERYLSTKLFEDYLG